MSSDYVVYSPTLALLSPSIYYTDKNKYREIDPFLIPVKTNSTTLEYAKEKWEYTTFWGYQLWNKIVTHRLSLYQSQYMSPRINQALPMNLDS